MSSMDDIIVSLRDHALTCGSKMRLSIDQYHLHKFVICECGYECDIPFVTILAAKEPEKITLQLQEALDFFNHPKFRQKMEKVIQEQKENEERRQKLERRKSAIGSLEI